MRKDGWAWEAVFGMVCWVKVGLFKNFYTLCDKVFMVFIMYWNIDVCDCCLGCLDDEEKHFLKKKSIFFAFCCNKNGFFQSI